MSPAAAQAQAQQQPPPDAEADTDADADANISRRRPTAQQQKRKRKIWSCTECRRRKLLCDRGVPACDRCYKSGIAAKCRYINHVPVASHRRLQSASEPKEDDAAAIDRAGASPPNDIEPPEELDVTIPASRLQALEQRLRTLESLAAKRQPSDHHQRQPHQAVRHPPTPDSLILTPDRLFGQDHISRTLFRGAGTRTKFSGTTCSDSIASRIPGFRELSKEAFATFPVLDEIRHYGDRIDARRNPLYTELVMPRPENLIAMLPSQSEVDQLVQIYQQSFDNIYHITHQPAFDRDYVMFWLRPADADSDFIVLLLMIVAIAYWTSAQQRHLEEDIASHQNPASIIIETCSVWMGLRDRRYETHYDFQIEFLFLLGKQLRAKRCKRTWANTGATLRSFMCAGMHRHVAPAAGESNRHEIELRKRLWFAIAEFELQAAFEHGMPASSWSQQSNISHPAVLHDHRSEPQLLEYFTKSSYLAVAARSLHFRHKLNNMLNDIRATITPESARKYTGMLQTYVREIPEWPDADSVAPRALLSIHILQYILALHEHQLQQDLSAVEQQSSRMILIDTSVKILDCHQRAIDAGSRVIEILSTDHTRAALAVCCAYITKDPETDSIFLAAMREATFRVVQQSVKLYSERVTYYRGDRRSFWLICTASALVHVTANPGDRVAQMRKTVDQFTLPFHRMIAKEKSAPAVSTTERFTRSSGVYAADTDQTEGSSTLQDHFGAQVGDALYLPAENLADWMFDEWPFDSNDLLSI